MDSHQEMGSNHSTAVTASIGLDTMVTKKAIETEVWFKALFKATKTTLKGIISVDKTLHFCKRQFTLYIFTWDVILNVKKS